MQHGPPPSECLICGNRQFVERYRKVDGIYYECARCNLLVSSLASRSDQLHDEYTGYEDDAKRNVQRHAQLEYCKEVQPRFLKELRLVEKYRRCNRLLDIGCGLGGFIFTARQNGW